MGRLADFWDGRRVTGNHKHHIEAMPEAKREDHRNRVRAHVFPYVPSAGKIIEWGAGGGLLSEEMRTHYNPREIILTDISEGTLRKAVLHVEGAIGIHIHDDPRQILEQHLEAMRDADLLLCHSVIQHFPGVKYWKWVAAVWEKIAPKHIAIQVKLPVEGLTNEHAGDTYFNGRNYLLGTRLSSADILMALPSYRMRYWKTDRQVANDQLIAYAVLAHAG